MYCTVSDSFLFAFACLPSAFPTHGAFGCVCVSMLAFVTWWRSFCVVFWTGIPYAAEQHCSGENAHGGVPRGWGQPRWGESVRSFVFYVFLRLFLSKSTLCCRFPRAEACPPRLVILLPPSVLYPQSACFLYPRRVVVSTPYAHRPSSPNLCAGISLPDR